jgi:hypothetical protein
MSRTVRARAKEWTFGVSKTGKEQIAVLFEVTQGEEQGYHFTWYGFFTPETTDRTLESMRHCGWESDSLEHIDTLGNNEVELVLEEEEYEGKVRTRVRWVNRPARLVVGEQMSPERLKAFAAKMRGKAVASKQKYGAQPQPTQDKPREQRRSWDASRQYREPSESQAADFAGADAEYADGDVF